MNIFLFFICMAGMREQQTHFTPAVYADAGCMQFSNGISFDIAGLGKAGEPALPPNLTYSPEQAEYFMVCLNGPIYQAQKDWLETNGFKILFPVSRYGFVGRITSRKNLDALRADPAVAWIGTYQPAYKISPLFDQVGQEYKTTMLVFMDQDIASVLAEVKTITGVEDLEVSDNGINKIIQGVINKKHLEALVRIPGVCWIEPCFPMQYDNVDVQWVVQTAQSNNRRIWNKGITGSRELDELVNSVDSGINVQHYAHRSGSDPIPTWGYYPDHNAIVAYDSGGPGAVFGDGSGAAYHGTATAGTLTGDDTTLGTSQYDGLAKTTRIYFTDVGGGPGINIWPDLNDIYIRPYNHYYPPARAHVSSNSWGLYASSAYTISSLQVDQFMWSHKDFAIFFAIGNSGPGSGTVNSPSTAKSVVAVGACQNGSNLNLLSSFSGRGPTMDGRYKPTICTPGQTVISSTGGTNTYGGLTGTSLACPSATAAGALLRQYMREGWFPAGIRTAADAWPYVSASMVKAALINSADNFNSEYAPSNNIGWGRVNLDSILFFAGDSRKLLLVDNTVGLMTGERVDYYFDVPDDSAKNLKICLAWTDYPGNPVFARQIVNDLDLSVYCDSGYYRGNLYSNGQSILNPIGRDSINVEECIRVNNPVAGSWRIAVEARNIMAGPQPFSLVVTYVGWSRSSALILDKPVYRANDMGSDTVRIQVEDMYCGSATTIDSLAVEVHSALAEPRPETVWCHELAESSYVFKGEIPLLFNVPVHGDGRVSVCQGDSVFVAYQDENLSLTLIARAGIDADYFTIMDVGSDTIAGNFATLTWRTSENANQTVYYGQSPFNLDQTVTIDTPYVFQHRVTLRNLAPETTYYFDVASRDFRGNRVRDDNNGFHYTFTTNRMTGIDILVVFADGDSKATSQGQVLPDTRNRFRKAVEQGKWTYTWWETSDHLGDLPSLAIMDNYKALFMPNEDEYPPFLTSQMESVLVYEEAGGRIAFSSHDLMWWCWDPAGGNPNVAAESLWCKNYLHARYKGDIMATGNFRIYGIAGDSVTGPYTSGITYSPHRSGADGDTVVGIAQPPNSWDTGGVSSDIWRWNAVAGNVVGCKWESGQTHGAPGQGIWGGYKTRTVLNAFSVTQLDTLILPDILNREFIWLIGHDHPDVWITSPVAGQTYIASPISISWYDSAYGGTQIDSTRIEYSPDAGQTWILIASGVDLISPYDWDISGLTNGARFRIRIWLNDQYIYPSLSGMDETGNFTILIPGNDHTGPRIIPQSILVSRNPMIVTSIDTLVEIRASVSDSISGLSIINAVTWSIGYNPAPPGCGGYMHPEDGYYNGLVEKVVDTLNFIYMPGAGQICTLWVRARDSVTSTLKNWGNAQMRTMTVIDGLPVLVGANDQGTTMPMQFAFMSPSPNPFRRHIALDYALPIPCRVELTIYNCLGQSVRILEESASQPGFYRRFWDGRDDLGRFVPAGVYFSRLSAGDFIQTRKMVLIR